MGHAYQPSCRPRPVATQLCWAGVCGVVVADGEGEEGDQPQQWWACLGIVKAAGGQHLYGGIVGAGGGKQACCGVGGAVAECQWRGGMTKAVGVPLRCWGGGGIAGA